MSFLVFLLCLGELGLAGVAGWLWLTVDELLQAQRARRRIDDAAARTLSDVRSLRRRAEEQLRRMERGW